MKDLQVSDFGKDHWSLLAYIETLCVDSRVKGVGEIDKRRLRCNEKRHPVHAVNMNIANVRWKGDYGTRLSGFFRDSGTTNKKRQIRSHDDWDCLEDFERLGLIEIMSEVNGFVRLTDKGLSLALRVREWKAKGGHFGTFKYAEPEGAIR